MGQGTTSVTIFRLLALMISLDISYGKIKSFTVTQITTPDSACIQVKDEVTLVCDAESDSSKIEIKRLQDGATLAVSRRSEKSLRYNIDIVSCSDMGTYECVLDGTERRTVDLVILYCPLQTCDGDAVQRSMFANFSEGINFSVCVLVCENISELAEFNDSLVRRKDLTNWNWHYEQVGSTDGSTGRFNIRVQRRPVEYGPLRLRIFSVQDHQYYVNFSIELKAPGVPDCPTGITITNYGHDYVILSWVPGSDGGSRQYFTVYHSTDNVTWPTQGSLADNTTAHITDLHADTSYYFRVVSMNRYRETVDPDVCDRTVFVTTNSFIQSREVVDEYKSSEILILTLSLCSILVVVVFLSAHVSWRRRKKLHLVQATETRLYEEIDDFQSDTPDRSGYLTNQTPHYVEIDDLRSDMPDMSVYLTTQTPEIPHYVEIDDFQSDLPDRSVCVPNQTTNIRDESVQYENTV